jgi:hypothetical protein
MSTEPKWNSVQGRNGIVNKFVEAFPPPLAVFRSVAKVHPERNVLTGFSAFLFISLDLSFLYERK